MLGALHETTYLDALRRVRQQEQEPALMPAFTAPGLEPDIPVGAGLVAAAHEGVRTAITAAQRVAAGAHFAYALCRPPGHHAGPAWLGGYCYLNTAAAATQTLLDAGAGPVGILDLDLHYPNGTSAIVAQMHDAELHSLHAWPVTNAPEDPVLPRTEREALVEFRTAPDAATYLDAVGAIGGRARALGPRARPLAGLRHRRRRSPRLMELRARASSPRSDGCSQPPGFRSASSKKAATRWRRWPTVATPSRQDSWRSMRHE